MNWRCKIGLHDWDVAEIDDRLVTPQGPKLQISVYNRCRRPECGRYPNWMLMDVISVRGKKTDGASEGDETSAGQRASAPAGGNAREDK